MRTRVLRRYLNSCGARRRAGTAKTEGHYCCDQRERSASIKAGIPAAEFLEQQRSAPCADEGRDAFRGIEDSIVRRRVPGAEVIASGGWKQRIDLSAGEVHQDEAEGKPGTRQLTKGDHEQKANRVESERHNHRIFSSRAI